MDIYRPTESDRLSFAFKYVKPYTYQYYKPISKNRIFTFYKTYPIINLCELYSGPDYTHKTIYDVIRSFFEFNGEDAGPYHNERKLNLNLPLYYLKQDYTKQLICNLKFGDFSHETETRLTLPDRILYSNEYIAEFNYYRFANMLNFNLIFSNHGFEYLYAPDSDHELIRVNGPLLTEMICFV